MKPYMPMPVQQLKVQQMPVVEEKPMVSPFMMPYQQPMWQQPVYQQPVSSYHPPKCPPVVVKPAPCSSPGEILVLFVLLVIISRCFLSWR